MRFSTIAVVSAIVLGVNAIAVANPDTTVYETAVVTVTSCPPEKPSCPASSSTAHVPVVTTPAPAPTTTPAPVTTAPVVTPAPVPSTPAAETPAEGVSPKPEAPVDTPIYNNGTTPVTPAPETDKPVVPAPVVPAPISTGTGAPSAPGNGSTPVVPVSPPVDFDGAGSKMGVSFLAIAGAAVFALMA